MARVSRSLLRDPGSIDEHDPLGSPADTLHWDDIFEEPTFFSFTASDAAGLVPTAETLPGRVVDTDPGTGVTDPVADRVNDDATATLPFEGLGVPRAPTEADPDPVVDDPSPEDPLPPDDDPLPDADAGLDDEPGATPTDAVPGLNQAAEDIFRNQDDRNADTFVFDADWGTSTITDFIDGERIDPVIAFSSSLFADFADLQAHMHQVDDDVVISDRDNNTLIIRDIDLAQLGADDFSFF
jgi:hypothetical protein